MTDHWLQSALSNDVLVAELLLQAKHSSYPYPDSDSDSIHHQQPPSTTTTTTTATIATIATTTSIASILPPRWGHRKNRSKSAAPTTVAAVNGGKEHRGSPTTHLSWSGGSTSDGYDESSRPSDLSSGCRSVKSFVDYKDEESSSLNDKTHVNRIDLDQNRRKKMRAMGEHQLQTNYTSRPQPALIPCRIEAETKAPQRGFVLPDLNMTPDDEDLAMMS